MKEILSAVGAFLNRIGSAWYQQFQKSETGGKAMLLIGTLVMFCCLCAVPVSMLGGGGDETPEPTVESAVGESIAQSDSDKGDAIDLEVEEAGAIADEEESIGTSEPASTSTDIPKPTETKTLTNTPEPTKPNTKTPTSTATPKPTATETLRPTETPTPPYPEGELAEVVRVVDGDTIDVNIDGVVYPVRYIGMDTPERGAVYFNESTQANADLVEGQAVVLVKDVSETDRYNRLLRYVYLLDGTFVNAELVRLGFAQPVTYPPDVAHQEEFSQLHQEARTASAGLWGLPTSTPIPPPTWTPSPLPTWTPAPLPTWTPPLPPTAAPQPTSPPPEQNCDPGYVGVCILIGVGDYDCAGGSGNGPNYIQGPFQVTGGDPHRLDGDNDGIGCE